MRCWRSRSSLLPHYVRIARAAVISEVSKDYVVAAKVAVPAGFG